MVFGPLLDLLLEGHNGVVEAKLKNRVGLMAGGTLHVNKVVNIIGVEHEGFLADDVAPETETIADEGIVGVVGGADGKPLKRIGGVLLFGTETVELLLLGEKGAVGEETVKAANAVKLVVCGNEVVVSISDGLEMAGSNIAGGSD